MDHDHEHEHEHERGGGILFQRIEMNNRLKRWTRLAPAERKVFLRAWIGLLACDLALRTLPFGIVQRFCSRRLKPGGRSPVGLRRMVELVAAAGRNHLYPMTCLRQSLVLQRLLARQGIACALRIGVRKTDGVLQAHAWLEKDGQVLEPGSSGFEPLRSGSGYSP